MGLNECAGYLAVAAAALGAGYLATAYGPRPAPYLIALGAALLGLAVTFFGVRETRHHVELESTILKTTSARGAAEFASGRAAHKPLFAANQAGLLTNLKEGVAWGLLPIFFAVQGLDVRQIALAGGVIPRGLGDHATRHRHAVGPDRTAPPDRGRASGSSSGACRVRCSEWIRPLGGFGCRPGYWHRRSLPDPHCAGG